MIDPWLLDKLACPRTKAPLEYDGNVLATSNGHIYRVLQDIPILIFDDGDITHPAFKTSLSISEIPDDTPKDDKNDIDWYVQDQVAATNGNLYLSLIGNLKTYPIPYMRLPAANDAELLLDIGCNWGRWSISAAKLGYHVIGIDPNVEAIFAAKRICQQLGISSAHFLVADARYLPFKADIFDIVFSYSVLQHLSKANVNKCLSDINHVLKSGGQSLIQMPNRCGVRNLYNQVRRVNKPDNIFRVRYWTNPELRKVFTQAIGVSRITVDGFLGLGIQPSDIDMLPPVYKTVVKTSEVLRSISKRVPFLTNLADSVYISSIKG